MMSENLPAPAMSVAHESVSNPSKVEEYRKGKIGIASMFIGDVMKKKKGLDPKLVKELITKKLNDF